MAFSLQQEKAGELHAGSMLSHPLIQSLTLSEDGIDCELSCNGETMDVDVKDVLKHGVSCWGKYSQVRIHLGCMPISLQQGIETTHPGFFLNRTLARTSSAPFF